MLFRERMHRGRGSLAPAAKETKRGPRLPLCRFIPFLVLTLAGCAGQEGAREEPAAADTAKELGEARQVGRYRFAEGSIVFQEAGSTRVIAVLPGHGPGTDTLSECGLPVAGLRAARFQLVRSSPVSGRVAWTSTAPGACLGVVDSGEVPVRILDRLSEAVPDSLFWAPDGGHLAAWLVHPGGRRSLSVYDARRGRRLEMPWEEECSRRDGCDVVSAEWLGNSLFDVKIRRGPAEEPIGYEVNVVGLAALEEEV